VGGGSRNSVLNQFVSDATLREVVAGPAEATAIGNILVQAMGSGHVQNHTDARTVIRNSFEVKRFEPQSAGNQWQDAFQRFLALPKN